MVSSHGPIVSVKSSRLDMSPAKVKFGQCISTTGCVRFELLFDAGRFEVNSSSLDIRCSHMKLKYKYSFIKKLKTSLNLNFHSESTEHVYENRDQEIKVKLVFRELMF